MSNQFQLMLKNLGKYQQLLKHINTIQAIHRKQNILLLQFSVIQQHLHFMYKYKQLLHQYTYQKFLFYLQQVFHFRKARYIHYPFSSTPKMHLITNLFNIHISIELYNMQLHLSSSSMQMHTFWEMLMYLINQMIQNILSHMQ